MEREGERESLPTSKQIFSFLFSMAGVSVAATSSLLESPGTHLSLPPADPLTGEVGDGTDTTSSQSSSCSLTTDVLVGRGALSSSFTRFRFGPSSSMGARSFGSGGRELNSLEVNHLNIPPPPGDFTGDPRHSLHHILYYMIDRITNATNRNGHIIITGGERKLKL